MKEIICIEVFIRHRKLWMFFYDFHKIKSPNGYFFKLEVSERKALKIKKKLEHQRIHYKYYEKRWGRSSNYRSRFFSVNPPPYRCRYCHRKIKKEHLQIDHIIPVGKLKNGEAKWLAGLMGIESVNDLRNLAPSCYRCNQSKGAKLGIWYIKAWLGQFYIYWIIRKIIFIMLCLYISYILIEYSFLFNY